MEVSVSQKDIGKTYFRVLRKVAKKYCKKDKVASGIFILDILICATYLVLLVVLNSYLKEWKYVFYDYYQNRMAYYFSPIFFYSSAFIVFYLSVIRLVVLYRIMIKAILNNFGSKDGKICLKDEGIYDCLAGSDAYQFFAYSTVRAIDNIHQHLVIVIGKSLTIAIPHTSFENEAHRIAFEGFLKEKCGCLE